MTYLAPSQFITNIVRNRKKLQMTTVITYFKIIFVNIDVMMFCRFERLRIK